MNEKGRGEKFFAPTNPAPETMQTQENPELLLIARMIEALVLQLQNKPEGADAQISDAWQAYYAARRKHGAG